MRECSRFGVVVRRIGAIDELKFCAFAVGKQECYFFEKK